MPRKPCLGLRTSFVDRNSAASVGGGGLLITKVCLSSNVAKLTPFGANSGLFLSPTLSRFCQAPMQLGQGFTIVHEVHPSAVKKKTVAWFIKCT